MIEMIGILVKAGAVGVIFFGIYTWYQAYRDLAQLNSGNDQDQQARLSKIDQLKVLADQLNKFRTMMILAFLIVACLETVQLFWPRPHVTLTVTPFDEAMAAHKPVLKKSGKVVNDDEFIKSGVFSEALKERAEYTVDVLRMRDVLLEQVRDASKRADNLGKLARAQNDQSAMSQRPKDAGSDRPWTEE